jgi:hypothetical protein
MAKLMSNRTDNDIKNKWYAMKRKDERAGMRDSRYVAAVAPPGLYQAGPAVSKDGAFQPRDWNNKYGIKPAVTPKAPGAVKEENFQPHSWANHHAQEATAPDASNDSDL